MSGGVRCQMYEGRGKSTYGSCLMVYGSWLIIKGGKEYLRTDDTTKMDVTDCDTLLKENTI